MFSSRSLIGAIVLIVPVTLVAFAVLLLGFLAVTREPVMIGSPHDTQAEKTIVQREYSTNVRESTSPRYEGPSTGNRPESRLPEGTTTQ